MGMDLVPVYADTTASRTPGSVIIPANVMHNLGVRTALVERGVFEQEIRTVGHVTFDEFQLLHIHPRVEGWIEALPDRQREALRLSRVAGLTHQEVAEAMDLSARTVNNHLVRALRTLRDRVRAYDPTLLSP